MSHITVRNFIRNYENGKYENPGKETMIAAGWYDWFCDEEELKPRLDELFPKVKQLSFSSKINIDKMYVFFKNNCPGAGSLYDDFRFCETEMETLVYTIIPASGHKKTEGQAELWGRENNFNEALAKGTWNDILAFFRIETRNGLPYKDAEGNEKFIGKFGSSTQEEFDDALSSIPDLIAKARQGDEEAGRSANELLWHLANEGFNTRTTRKGIFQELYSFGKQGVAE